MTDTEREKRMRDLVVLVVLVVDPVRRYLHRRTEAAMADDVIGDATGHVIYDEGSEDARR